MSRPAANLIDTADVYGAGVSEEFIGRWLAVHPTEREQMVIATKGRFPMGVGPNDVGTSRRHLTRALDASLGRLGVNQIDLYQLHAWDAVSPLEETLRFLDDALRGGKIAYYGLSNFTGWQLTKAVHVARAHGFTPPVTLQPQYSLLEREIVPAALDAGLGLCRGRRSQGMAHRKVQSGHRPGRRHPPRRRPDTRYGGMGAPQRAEPDLVGH